MATIELYASKVNNMPSLIKDVKSSVSSLKSEILKKEVILCMINHMIIWYNWEISTYSNNVRKANHAVNKMKKCLIIMKLRMHFVENPNSPRREFLSYKWNKNDINSNFIFWHFLFFFFQFQKKNNYVFNNIIFQHQKKCVISKWGKYGFCIV